MPLSHHRKQTALKVGGIILLLLGILLVVMGSTGTATAESASPPHYQSQALDNSLDHPATDLACRLCHSESDNIIEFPSGELLPVQVNIALLDNSAHGEQADKPLACTNCHTSGDNYRFPHEAITATDLRTYEQERSTACQQCHVEPHITSHAGPDDPNPVICTDCHGSHDVITVADWERGDGTGKCINCHNQANVPLVVSTDLTAVIRNGLFAERIDNDYCLACHSQTNFSTKLESGETLYITINEADFHASVHGEDNPWQPLDCVDCHNNYRFPHNPIEAETKREYTLSRYELCAECHEHTYDLAMDSTHATALANGVLEAAVCTDCHGAHYTPVPNEPRSRISETCRQCHSTIYRDYAGSVHGDALLTESNEDVPTCIDCHGVHNINDPNTALFRVQSPELCGSCHANDELMGKYDISTDVFETYVADFHGTTVTLFDHQDPNVETNKAVCYDCHGVHNIKKADDPAGVKANLLETCRQCHPDASANFPDSWTSHFRPSLEHNPLVYLINLFYTIVIPTTVGAFLFLVGTDIYRRIRVRFFRPN